jgi:predicted DNA-binding protein YlxM (UPF0122 family)
MRLSIERHEQNLQMLDEKIKLTKDYEERHNLINKSCKLESQIKKARKEGRECFDAEKYKVRKKRKVKMYHE